MFKPENYSVEEKTTKKKKNQVPEDGGQTDPQGKTEKVKKKKKKNGIKAAAGEVAHGKDVCVVKEESGGEATKGKKKKKTEQPPGEGDQDPARIASGKGKRRKKGVDGEEKGKRENWGSAKSNGAADVTVGNREGKTAAKKGNGKRTVPSDAAGDPTGNLNEEKKTRRRRNIQKGDNAMTEVANRGQKGEEDAKEGEVLDTEGNVPCGVGSDEVQESEAKEAPKKRKRKRKKTAVADTDARCHEGKTEELGENKKIMKKKKNMEAASVATSVRTEASAGESGGGESEDQKSKKEKRSRRKEKAKAAVSGEGALDVGGDAGEADATEAKKVKGDKKKKKKVLGVEADISTDACAADRQNDGAEKGKGAPKEREKKGSPPKPVPSLGDGAGGEVGEHPENGVKSQGKKRKKKEEFTREREHSADTANVKEGGDSEEKTTKEGKKAKTIKGEKRKALAEVGGESAVESLNGQEGEGQPNKKKKKQERADVVGSEEQAATPRRRKVKEIGGPGNGEKRKRKGKQEGCVEEGGDGAAEKKGGKTTGVEERDAISAMNSVKGKKCRSSANGGIRPEKDGGEENTSPKKGSRKGGQGQDGEAVEKLRQRKKQSKEEGKINPVKSVPKLNTTSPQVDVVFVSEKTGNKDEVRIDQARRQALQMEVDNESRPKDSNSSTDLGQWGTAHFESANQQQKFLRLMGGFKKGSQPVGLSEGRANMALGKEEQGVLQQGLLGEFERAQSRLMDFQNRGGGLGFTPPSNKKFFIDVNASNSVRFGD